MLPNEETEELLYRIALTLTPSVGSKTARLLIEHFGSATKLFRAPLKEIKHVSGVGEVRARGFRDVDVLQRAEREVAFVLKNELQALYPGNNYPERLLNCVDAPGVLYFKGNADLNAAKIVAIVGTRKNTEYGVKLCDELIEGLQGLDRVLVVSGLALGIDAIAHRKCVAMQLPNVGVLGHGLDRIYPAVHKQLAKQMVDCGGLLTEFPSGTIPDRQNFPMRNRVVAGLSDITIVVESQAGGGALITAHLAAGYNREVAAYPGRVHDSRSSGCNELIRTNLAAMVTKADDVVELMNWADKAKRQPVQRQLFVNLSPDEEKLIALLNGKDLVHADEFMHSSGLMNSQLAATLLQLEMQGLIKTLPGKYYRMV
jgi:DNA processing protein